MLPSLFAWPQRLWRRRPVEMLISALVFLSCAYFCQGGGWNQNAHLATTVSLVEDGNVYVDRFRDSSGDLAFAGEHVVANKPIGTALVAAPAYALARLLVAAVELPGDRVILSAYLTTVLTMGTALCLLALLLYRLLLRRLTTSDAALLTLGMVFATPLWPNSTMLSAHTFAALFALSAYALLERPPGAAGPVPRQLFFAGLCAGLPAAFEYLMVVVLVPLGLYAFAAARLKRNVGYFALGALAVLSVPLVHHALLYGNPLRPSYASAVTPEFAALYNHGLFGFDGISVARLYELTFGQARGCFFLSPFLVAAVPGLLRMLRNPNTRREAFVVGGVAWLVMLLVASYSFWHSGSSTGSRYTIVFVAFSALPAAVVLPLYRRWMSLGMFAGYTFMLIATSVTAIPPTPRGPPYANVLGWWWERFSRGELAAWQQAILVQPGVGAGEHNLPFAFNLGQLLGLPGLWSLLPYLGGVVALCFGLFKLLYPGVGARHA